MLSRLSSPNIIRNFAKAFSVAASQGISGNAGLITGNFSAFNKSEASTIQRAIDERGQALVILYDRDSIDVPANERSEWIRRHFKDDDRLEVRVAYAPPPEAGEEGYSSDKYSSYLQNQIPKHIKPDSVFCGNDYSKSVADKMGIEYLGASKQQEDDKKQELVPEAYEKLKDRFNNGVIDESEFVSGYKSHSKGLKEKILQSNKEHPAPEKIFQRTPWNLDNLNRNNPPVVVGDIDDKDQQEEFSKRGNTQVFDMPIYMPGQGWKIPKELKPYEGALQKIVAAESISNDKMLEGNVYITVDSGVVPPEAFARRGGLHVDGFLTSANEKSAKDGTVWGDNTYLISDDPDLQTECYPGPFDLSDVDKDSPGEVLKAFEEQGADQSYVQKNAYDIVRITTNNVHAVKQNSTGQHLQRSFVKVTFSERSFNRSGNTINPYLDYRYAYVPRGEGRNTQNFSGAAPKDFKNVDLNEVNFEDEEFPTWVSKLTRVKKDQSVTVNAAPATEGERLDTVVDGTMVTKNIAQKGDIKVTRKDGDSYFLSRKEFESLYASTGNEDEYRPNKRSLDAVKVGEDVSFIAPWGTRQNVPKGGYVVSNAEKAWGVHPESFAATYKDTSNGTKQR